MLRFFLSAALVVATPCFSETKSEKSARCDAQAAIIGQAVEMRLARKSEAKTKEAVLDSIDEKYAGSVPMLVGHIYTMARKDLKSVDKEEFAKQCLTFNN